jgi:hypothetical protein
MADDRESDHPCISGHLAMLRAYLMATNSELDHNWGCEPHEIEDEHSYDLGKLHGISITLALLERMAGQTPQRSEFQ